MRIEYNQNASSLTFRDLKVGTPFYDCDELVKSLYMKTEDVNREEGTFINAVNVSNGVFILFPEYKKVKVARVHVESDKG